jgi:hypothetical protein
MVEHAGHHPAVHRIEHEDQVEDEQDEVAFARVLHHEEHHHGAHHQVGRVPEPGAHGSDVVELPPDVEPGDRDRDDVGDGDEVIGQPAKARVELVLAQFVEHVEHEHDRQHDDGEHRRPALAGDVIGEQIDEEEYRERIVERVDGGAQVRGGGIGCHWVRCGFESVSNSACHPGNRRRRLSGTQ